MEELTPLAVATTQLHEMFEALQEAGFTPVAGVVTYKRTYAAGEATYAVGDTVTMARFYAEFELVWAE